MNDEVCAFPTPLGDLIKYLPVQIPTPIVPSLALSEPQQVLRPTATRYLACTSHSYCRLHSVLVRIPLWRFRTQMCSWHPGACQWAFQNFFLSLLSKHSVANLKPYSPILSPSFFSARKLLAKDGSEIGISKKKKKKNYPPRMWPERLFPTWGLEKVVAVVR